MRLRSPHLKTSFVFLFLVSMCFGLRGISAADNAFRVGVAHRDITPAAGAPMWGYGDREGEATGVLDPLFAKAIVFRVGERTVGLVTLDLGRVPLPDVMDRIRERVRSRGIEEVVFTASHTHSAPSMDIEGASHVGPMEKKIGDALEEAVRSLEPAVIGVGSAEVDIAHNRRVIRGDGSVFMMWRNEERLPTSPVDKEMRVIEVENLGGDTLAVLVHYACHPVVLGPDNLEYSADFPGAMARVVEEKTGGLCFFLQGGCGDINPYLDKQPVDEGGADAVANEGAACGQAVLAALEEINPSPAKTPSLKYHREEVLVGTRKDLPAVLAYIRSKKGLSPDLTVPLTLLVLNDEIGLVGMPGEVFVDFQTELKDNGPLPHTLLLGYADDYHAYFPTVRDAVLGGYGGAEATYVDIGAGDKLTTRAQIELARMLGKMEER